MPSAERLAAETEVARLLDAHEFRAAALSVGHYEARQPSPRGIGVDWSRYDPARDTMSLECIYGPPPGILACVREDALPLLRRAAGMLRLWGQGKVRRVWLPRDLPTGTRFSPDVAARMLSAHAQSLAQLAQYRQPITRSVIDRKGMRIASCPDSCAPCLAISGLTYTLDTLPELPHADCTAPNGCRCCYSTGSG